MRRERGTEIEHSEGRKPRENKFVSEELRKTQKKGNQKNQKRGGGKSEDEKRRGKRVNG